MSENGKKIVVDPIKSFFYGQTIEGINRCRVSPRQPSHPSTNSGQAFCFGKSGQEGLQLPITVTECRRRFHFHLSLIGRHSLFCVYNALAGSWCFKMRMIRMPLDSIR